jgi:hypothetical protein
MKNGKLVTNLDTEGYATKDNTHNNFFIRGQLNNKPFIATNVKGILKKRRLTNKKRKSVRFRTPTPYPKNSNKKKGKTRSSK